MPRRAQVCPAVEAPAPAHMGLARAVGADERLDAEAVRNSYESLKPMDTVIRQPRFLGPKLEPPVGADLQTEFL